MKKWLFCISLLLFAIQPTISSAGPIADLGLEVIGVNTSTSGPAGNSSVTFGGAVGDIGKSFSLTAQSGAAGPSIAFGLGSYGGSNSSSSSASWDILFKINQPDLTVDISFNYFDFARAVTVAYAYARGDAYTNISLNGGSQLADHQGTSCNTVISSCDNSATNGNQWDIIISHLIVGETIDIAGSLSTSGSGTAGPICGDIFGDSWTCFGLGIGQAGAGFTITAVPEPDTLTLFGAALFLGGLFLGRKRRLLAQET